ncbi:MAG: hypothetical protein AAF499_02435, partial [Pseudomonadota bacterium]
MAELARLITVLSSKQIGFRKKGVIGMRVLRFNWAAVLVLCLGGAVHAADTYRSKQHSCSELRSIVAEQGSIKLKVFLGTLTLHHEINDCRTGTHQVLSPAWRTT